MKSVIVWDATRQKMDLLLFLPGKYRANLKFTGVCFTVEMGKTMFAQRLPNMWQILCLNYLKIRGCSKYEKIHFIITTRLACSIRRLSLYAYLYRQYIPRGWMTVFPKDSVSFVEQLYQEWSPSHSLLQGQKFHGTWESSTICLVSSFFLETRHLCCSHFSTNRWAIEEKMAGLNLLLLQCRNSLREQNLSVLWWVRENLYIVLVSSGPF